MTKSPRSSNIQQQKFLAQAMYFQHRVLQEYATAILKFCCLRRLHQIYIILKLTYFILCRIWTKIGNKFDRF